MDHLPLSGTFREGFLKELFDMGLSVNLGHVFPGPRTDSAFILSSKSELFRAAWAAGLTRLQTVQLLEQWEEILPAVPTCLRLLPC